MCVNTIYLSHRLLIYVVLLNNKIRLGCKHYKFTKYMKLGGIIYYSYVPVLARGVYIVWSSFKSNILLIVISQIESDTISYIYLVPDEGIFFHHCLLFIFFCVRIVTIVICYLVLLIYYIVNYESYIDLI